MRKQAQLQADILLVPHQGSKTSSTDQFLDSVKPSLAILAAGYLNHYGHPHKDVLRRYHVRGIKTLSTVDSGSIEIAVSDGGFTIRRYRQYAKRFWHWRP